MNELQQLKAENDTIRLNLTLAEGAAETAEKELDRLGSELLGWKIGAGVAGGAAVILGILYALK